MKKMLVALGLMAILATPSCASQPDTTQIATNVCVSTLNSADETTGKNEDNESFCKTHAEEDPSGFVDEWMAIVEKHPDSFNADGTMK